MIKVKKIITIVMIMLCIGLFFTGCTKKAPAPFILKEFEYNFNQKVNWGIDYGIITRAKFLIGSEYDEVCFLKSKKVILKGDNIENHAFDVEKMIVDEDFCIEPTEGLIVLRMEGDGSNAQITVWD